MIIMCHHTLSCPDIVMVYLMYVGYLRQDHINCVLYTAQHGSQTSQAMLCHGFEPGVLAGKLCVRDAQVSNAVYVPTPPYVMGLSQASWQGSCASGTHKRPTLSTFPRHILTTDSLVLYCNVISNVCGYLYLDHYNVIRNCILHTPQADDRESSVESAILCHGFESGVLAGKLCVRDAHVSNHVYVATPPYVLSFSHSSLPGTLACVKNR